MPTVSGTDLRGERGRWPGQETGVPAQLRIWQGEPWGGNRLALVSASPPALPAAGPARCRIKL